MPPSPTPTSEDIDLVREVAGENDYTFISTLIDNLNDAQWARALDFMTAWDEYGPGEVLELTGQTREGVKLSDQGSRDDIRVRMRLLLGLPEQRSGLLTGGPASVAVPNLWTW
jgi:hypothetical protein